ncbi:MAG: OmpA family protein [Bacteroidetes bacterium]|nr:OmpA family protein [Bacteroidota bacterium]
MFSVILHAQNPNLIPNPGFEDYLGFPDKKNPAKYCISQWSVPYQAGAGDYYHTKANPGQRPEDNKYGSQKPFDGEAMTAICNYPGFREFLQTKLTRTLSRDSVYQFTVRISCADGMKPGDVLTDFGVVFLPAEVDEFDGEPLLREPPAMYWRNENGFADKENWIELKQTYKAKGNERVLLFGSFHWKDSLSGKVYGNVNYKRYTHYYIDGFELRKITQVKAQTKDDEKLFVNTDLLVLRNLLFATASDRLDTNSTAELDVLATYLLRHPEKKIRITGHTDSEGDSTANMWLSLARAASVKHYLVQKGISAVRLQTAGKGENEPLIQNTTPEGRQQNRRVEIRLLKD